MIYSAIPASVKMRFIAWFAFPVARNAFHRSSVKSTDRILRFFGGLAVGGSAGGCDVFFML